MAVNIRIKYAIIILSLFLVAFFSIIGAYFFTTQYKSVTPFLPSTLTARYCDFHYSKSFNVSCYYYWTHDKGSGFKLPIALIKHKNSKDISSRHLLMQIPGGPGQGSMATSDEISFWVEWLETNRLTFDLLLYDPRGTGADTWQCDTYRNAIEEIASVDIGFEKELSVLSDHLSRCFIEYDRHIKNEIQSNVEKKTGLGAFSSSLQADDIQGITTALGYKNIHLWGTSYGGRLALLAAKFENIKSLVLDSPYAFEHGHYSEWPGLYENSFVLHERLFLRLFPESKKNYVQLYKEAEARLKIQGLALTANHWIEKRDIPFFLNSRRFLELNFFVLYNANLYKPYYLGLEELVKTGRVSDDLKQVIESFLSNAFDGGFNYMAYFATECVDNEPEDESKVLNAINQSPNLHAYFLTEWQYNACKLFDFSGGEYIQRMSYQNKPTLIFAGEFDPVTPTTWAFNLSKKIPKSRYVSANHLGHGVLFDMSCDWRFLTEFFEKGTTNIDIVCENS